MSTAKAKDRDKFYRLRCSDAVLHTFGQHSLALQPRDAKGKVLDGPDGRVFCRLKITDGPFQVFDQQGLNPRPFQLIQGPLPPEISAAVKQGRILAELVSDAGRIAERDVFDATQSLEDRVKPERIQ